jgi:RNA polymerase sigma-70 factor (ECF subfamily)
VASPPDNHRSPRPALPGEERLIRSAQRGDRNASSALVEHYWDRLFRWLYQLTHDRHAAEDLAQESFLRAFGALGRFQAGTNFSAWLFRIAHNAWANQRRATRPRDPLPAELPGREADPVDEALSREALQELGRAVAKVPDELRGAFLLRVEEGLSFREIADVLGLTEETARWRVFKARQRLLSLLAAHLEREKS